MGLLNRAAMMGGLQNMAAPNMQMPGASGGQFGGMLGAFSGSPAFQTQLSQIMQGAGPGHQAPQFTPPAVQARPASGQAGFGAGQIAPKEMPRFSGLLGQNTFLPMLQSQMFRMPQAN